MSDQERVRIIKGLECCIITPDFCRDDCPYIGKGDENNYCDEKLFKDAITFLKAQGPATVEPKCIELADETKAWLDKMDAVDALANIADICVDWDGYRTADGLGGLVNEIWAYARYYADRIAKAQEPRILTPVEYKEWCVGNRKTPLLIERRRIHKKKHEMYWLNAPEGAVHVDEEYGKSFVVWTGWPTDEQREAIPWN